MQDASCHTPIEHPVQASPAVTRHSAQIRSIALGGAHDLINDGARDDARPGPDTLATELLFQSGQIRFRLLPLLLKLLVREIRIVSLLRPRNNRELVDYLQENQYRAATQT